MLCTHDTGSQEYSNEMWLHGREGRAFFGPVPFLALACAERKTK